VFYFFLKITGQVKDCE